MGAGNRLDDLRRWVELAEQEHGTPGLPETTTFLPRQEIAELVRILSADLDAVYHRTFPHLLVILDAAYIFAADLTRLLHFPHTVSFAHVKSYEGATKGRIRTLDIPEREQLRGRNVIMVDTIVGTGDTLRAVAADLYGIAHTVSACCLLRSQDVPTTPFTILSGWPVDPSRFYIGYGLDWHGAYRNWPYICSTPKENCRP